jgi:hypothetical protein
MLFWVFGLIFVLLLAIGVLKLLTWLRRRSHRRD